MIGSSGCLVDASLSSPSLVVCTTQPQGMWCNACFFEFCPTLLFTTADGLGGTFQVQLSAQGGQGHSLAVCSGFCTFTYSGGAELPEVHLRPSAALSGSELAFIGELRTNSLSHLSVSLEGSLCYFSSGNFATLEEASLRNQGPPNSAGQFADRGLFETHWWACRGPDLSAGQYAWTTNVQPTLGGAGGNAWQASLLLPFGVADKLSSPAAFTYVAVVEAISTQTGEFRVGSVVSITGKGFVASSAGKQSIRFGPLDCAILTSAWEQVTCILGETTQESWTSQISVGPRGLLSTISKGTATSPSFVQVDALHGWAHLAPHHRNHPERQHYQQQWEGFFVPPYSGMFSFTVFADDFGRISMSNATDAALAQPVAETRFNSSLMHAVAAAQRRGLDLLPVSAPMWLEQGNAYFMRFEHTESNGGGFFSAGLRLQAPRPWSSSESSKLAALQHSLPSAWVISLDTDVVREQQLLSVRGAADSAEFLVKATSSFTLHQDATAVDRDSSTSSVAQQVRLALQHAGHACNSIRIHTAVMPAVFSSNATLQQASAALSASGWDWRVTFDCPSETVFPSLQLVAAKATPPRASAVVASGTVAFAAAVTTSDVRLQPPSTPLGGSWSLSMGSASSASLSASASGNDVRIALLGLLQAAPEQIGAREYTPQVTVATHGNGKDSRWFLVQLRWPAMQAPVLQVSAQSLLGSGGRLGLDVVQVGDADMLEYDAIPMDYFRTAIEDQPSSPPGSVLLSMAVNGVAAVCNINVTGSASTPSGCSVPVLPAVLSLTSIWPMRGTAGTTISLEGDGFTTALQVTVGGAVCTVHVWNSTFAQCDVGAAQAGSMPIVAHIDEHFAVGHNASFTVFSTVSSVQPGTFSTAGGTTVVIRGLGFMQPASDNIVLQASSSGASSGSPMDIVEGNFSVLVARSVASQPGALLVTVNGVAAVQPLIASPLDLEVAVTPLVAPASVITDFTLKSNITDMQLDSVMIGDRPCVDLVVSNSSSGGSQAECTVFPYDKSVDNSRSAAPVTLAFGNMGALLASASVNSAFQVTAVNTTNASLAGGAAVLILGIGFDPQAGFNEVQLVYRGDASSAGFACQVLSASSTELLVILPPVPAGELLPAGSFNASFFGSVTEAAPQLEVRTNGVRAGCVAPGQCAVRLALEFTPSCSSVRQSSSSESLLSIEGEALASTLAVSVGSSACALLAVNSTHVECNAGVLPAGEFEVSITTPTGHARACSQFPAVFTSSVQSFSPAVGSTAGGAVITIVGKGFDPSPGQTRVLFGEVEGFVLTSSTTMLTVLSPVSLQSATLPLLVQVTNEGGALEAEVPSGAFTFVPPSASVLSMSASPAPGSSQVVTLTGTGLNSADVSVSFGGEACVITAQTSTNLTCTISQLPAGSYQPVVQIQNQGRAFVAQTVQLTALASLSAFSGTSVLGGGSIITVTGRGLPLGLSASSTGSTCATSAATVFMCGLPATVVAAQQFTNGDRQLSLSTPALRNELLLTQALGLASSFFEPSQSFLSRFRGVSPQVFVNGQSASIGDTAFDGDVSVLQRLQQGGTQQCSFAIDVSAQRVQARLARAKVFTTQPILRFVVEARNASGAWETLTDQSPPRSVGWVAVALVADQPSDNTELNTDILNLPAFDEFRVQLPLTDCNRISEVGFEGLRVASEILNEECEVEVRTPAVCGSTALGTAPISVLNASASITVPVETLNSPHVARIVPEVTSAGNTGFLRISGLFQSPAFARPSNGDVTVRLAGADCTVFRVLGTQIVCRVTRRSRAQALAGAETSLFIAGVGAAVFSGPASDFIFLDAWSQPGTWPGGVFPTANSIVTIPAGQAVEVDMSVQVRGIIIQGELFWSSTLPDLQLSANFILVHGGHLQLGAEDAPLAQRATVRLLGRRDEEVFLPALGTKVLAVMDVGLDESTRHGRFSAFGSRALANSSFPLVQEAAAGSSSIVTEGCDWEAGDTVAVSATSHGAAETELRTVAAVTVSANGTCSSIISSPLEHQHTAHVFPVDSTLGRLDARARVARMSHNIVFEGDSASGADEFGASLVAFRGGVLNARGVEFRQCGQALRPGSHCIHLRDPSTGGTSSVTHSSIHSGYNRGLVMSGVHDVSISGLAIAGVRGHGLAFTNGDEAGSDVTFNTVFGPSMCSGCELGDLEVAGIFSASTRNTLASNTVLGSDGMGFKLAPGASATGSTANPEVCPNQESVTSFTGSTALYSKLDGLQLLTSIIPVSLPCGDPFSLAALNNTQTVSVLQDLLLALNGRFGMSLREIGAVSVSGLVSVGNGAGQVVVEKVTGARFATALSHPHVQSAFLAPSVGALSNSTTAFGLATPGSEFFVVAASILHGFRDAAAVVMCPTCAAFGFGLQGGYTAHFRDVVMSDSIASIDFSSDVHGIVADLTSSLFPGHGARWITASSALFSGITGCSSLIAGPLQGLALCNASVPIRRVHIDQANPQQIRTAIAAHIAPGLAATNADFDMAAQTTIAFDRAQSGGWTLAAPLRNTLRLEFLGSEPWSNFRIRFSEPDYLAVQDWLSLVFVVTDGRYSNDVRFGVSPQDFGGRAVGGVPVVSVPARGLGNEAFLAAGPPQPEDHFGTSFLQQAVNSSDALWFLQLNNRFNASTSLGAVQERFSTHRATVVRVKCPPAGCPVPAPGPDLGAAQLWSDAATWVHMREMWGLLPSEPDRVPLPGDAVFIPDGLFVLLDLMETPVLAQLDIFGRLEFADVHAVVLRAGSITVQSSALADAGSGLFAGSLGEPRVNSLTIELHATASASTVRVGENVFLPGPVFAVYGNVSLHGQPASPSWTRLAATASAGDNTILVKGNVTWTVGSTVVITASAGGAAQTETVNVTAVGAAAAGNTLLSLARPLLHTHEVLQESVASWSLSPLRLAPAVGLVSRLVRVQAVASASASAGASIQVGTFDRVISQRQVSFSGSLHASSVEFAELGAGSVSDALRIQRQPAQVAFDDTLADELASSRHSAEVLGCAFHGSNSGFVTVMGSANNVKLDRNVFVQSVGSAVTLRGRITTPVWLRNNLIAGVQRPGAVTADPFAGLFLFARPRVVHGNLVAGSDDQGIALRPELCAAGNDTSATGALQTGNEVHNTEVGFFLIAAHLFEFVECQRFVGNTAWRSRGQAVLTVDQTSHILIHSVVIVDAHVGISLNYFRSAATSFSWLHNSLLLSETSADSCADCVTTGTCPASTSTPSFRRVAVLLPQYTNRAKTCGAVISPSAACWPPTRPVTECGLPWDERYGLQSTQHQEMLVEGLHLAGFGARCTSSRNAGFKLNPTQSDAATPVRLSNMHWNNVPLSTRMSFHPQANSTTPCSSGACDAFRFAVLSDLDGSTFGQGPAVAVGDTALAPFAQLCSKQASWGEGFLCTGQDAAPKAFVLENLDEDRAYRSLHPVTVSRAGLNGTAPAVYTVSGAFADSCANSADFGQLNTAIPPTTLPVILHTASLLPGQLRLHWFASNPSDVFVLALFVRQPFRFQVNVGDTLGIDVQRRPTTFDPHGSFFFSAAERTLWITMRGGLPFQAVTVVRSSVIQLDFTFAISVDEFYGSSIVENLARLLGVAVGDIIVAGVQAASSKASLLVLPPSGTQFPSSPSKIDSRLPEALQGADLTSCVVDESGLPQVESCRQSGAAGTYLADVTVLHSYLNTLQQSLKAGTLSRSLGAEILKLDVTLPPAEATAEGDADSFDTLSLVEQQSEQQDPALSTIIVMAVSLFACAIVIGTALAVWRFQRASSAHIRQIQRLQAKKGTPLKAQTGTYASFYVNKKAAARARGARTGSSPSAVMVDDSAAVLSPTPLASAGRGTDQVPALEMQAVRSQAWAVPSLGSGAVSMSTGRSVRSPSRGTDGTNSSAGSAAPSTDTMSLREMTVVSIADQSMSLSEGSGDLRFGLPQARSFGVSKTRVKSSAAATPYTMRDTMRDTSLSSSASGDSKLAFSNERSVGLSMTPRSSLSSE